MTSEKEQKRKNFFKSFGDGGHNTCKCACGQFFFREDNVNELTPEERVLIDKLLPEGKATPIGYSIGIVHFQGKTYSEECTCWHDHIDRAIAFVESNAHYLASYLQLEKERKQSVADAATVIA